MLRPTELNSRTIRLKPNLTECDLPLGHAEDDVVCARNVGSEHAVAGSSRLLRRYRELAGDRVRRSIQRDIGSRRVGHRTAGVE